MFGQKNEHAVHHLRINLLFLATRIDVTELVKLFHFRLRQNKGMVANIIASDGATFLEHFTNMIPSEILTGDLSGFSES